MTVKGLTKAIETVLSSRVLEIPLRQRAKFEGWLKLELGNHLERIGGIRTDLELEYIGTSGSRFRADLATLPEEGQKSLVMLKTVNTNFRFDGVESKGRPITKNIEGVAEDVRKLKDRTSSWPEAYVLFTAAPMANDPEVREVHFREYLRRVSAEGFQMTASGFVIREAAWGISWFLGRVQLKVGGEAATVSQGGVSNA